MKRTSLFASAALAILSSAPSAPAAVTDMSTWTHLAPIDLPTQPAKGLIEVPLTPEIFALARPDFADLRVLNQAGDAVPFVLRTDRGTPARAESYTPRLFNPLFTPGKQSSVEADFGTRAQRTRIDITTPGTNFRRRVSIEASQDGTTWQTLKRSDWLFRIRFEGGAYDKSQVLLPDNDFRYLRITVFPAPDDPEQLDIQRVTAWRETAVPAQLADVPTKTVKVNENAQSRVTEIQADLGFENLPVALLGLEFSDPLFVRRVELLGRNVKSRTVVEPVENSQPRTREVDEPWSTLATGSVYRLPGGEGQEPSTGLSLPLDAQCRYLLVRVFNGDDPHLSFTSLKVQRLQEYLDIRPQPAGPYQLYVGNAHAERPRYDLENYAQRLRSEAITPAKLGPPTANPLFALPTKTIPWSEQHALLLWSTLGVVLLVLAGLVVRQAKQAKTVGTAPPP